PESNVLWIADPKYSEAKGYSLRDYIEVAERYRDDFKTHQVWICEFYSRREWFKGDCYKQGDKFKIITEVQPKGEGVRLLRRDLRRFHNFSTNQFVLAVDCSGSFEGTLPDLKTDLQSLASCASVVICFADTVKEISDTTLDFALINKDGGLLGSGTALLPLVEALENLEVRDCLFTELVLITDGEFSDSSSELMARLNEMFSIVEVVGDQKSLSRICAVRCETLIKPT
ncbi:MAG: hypothetical protein ACYSRQ_06430, partial [Planctomycetota bacterium]